MNQANQLAGSDSRPFWADVPARTSRRGNFWVPGERVTIDGKTYQRAPMFVAWEAPERVTQPHPIVLVHGGAMQGTEWLDTPDGRPGWAQRLVEAGYAVLVVDRPSQGRSPFHPDVVGAMGPAFPYEEGRDVFFPTATTAGAAAEHLHLPDHGVLGNGHGLIYETNSDQALQPVLQWLTTRYQMPTTAAS